MSVAATTSCIVCFEVVANGLSCCEGHTMCDSCFDSYINEQAEALEGTNLLAIKFDVAEQTGDSRQTEFLAGASLCPLRGHGCTAAPFDARAVAMHSTPAAFTRHLAAKTLLTTARRVQEILHKRSELSSMLPNARMCGRCSYGPIELVGCNDLTTHHGQVMGGSSVPIDNSCRRCGWFEENISRWPVWQPTGLEGDEDPVEAAFAQQAEAETEEAAAARRAAREESIRLFREERAQREETSRQTRMLAAAERRRVRESRLRRRAEWEQDEGDGGRYRPHRALAPDAIGDPMGEMMADLFEQMMEDGELPAPAPIPPEPGAVLFRRPRLPAPQLAVPTPAPPPAPPPAPRPPTSVESLQADLRAAAAEREAAATGPQAVERHDSLALLSRLTGLDAESGAARMYLEDADGDVVAAVRAAVQGSAGY